MKGAELKAMRTWIEQNIGDDEPVLLKFPRREARKRIQNKEKSKRIVITTDEQNFSEFHAIREAYMHFCEENPTLVGLAIISAMKAFDLKGFLEEMNAAK